MSSTTSIRVSTKTLLWVKRLQGILQYQFNPLNIDETIKLAAQFADWKMARGNKMTKEELNDYTMRIDKQIEEQGKGQERDRIHLF